MSSKRKLAPTVLVVDDQETLTRLMCKTLESNGFRVLTANSGADALTLCRGAEPPVDLLVTDYSMPGMTGLELAHKCRRLNHELGVLYVTGSSPGDDLLRDLNTERHGLLAKPFRHSELLRSAKALLDMEPVAPPSWETHGSRKERLSVER